MLKYFFEAFFQAFFMILKHGNIRLERVNTACFGGV